MATIPLHLVNGFLGSGKTTFLMHYLNTFSANRKIGVIQNEFSAAGIDGELIRRQNPNYNLLEINNGSVFCVCLLGNFIDSLAAFIDDHSPDELILEASGMSDPISIGQIFQSPKLRNKVYLGYAWTIVDACNFHKTIAIRSRLDHQIRVADTVIINKIDLSSENIDELKNTVKKINPFATIELGTFANIDFDNMKKPNKFTPFLESLESCRPELNSVVIKTSKTIALDKLMLFIDLVKTDFIRFKGYVNVGKTEKMIVQGTFDQYTFEKTEWFMGNTELVAIGHFDETVNYTHKFETFCKS